MFRSFFGDPKPSTLSELREAIEETNLDTSTASVWIDDSRDELSPFTGWTAELTGNTPEDDDEMIGLSTAGFPTREELVAALIEVGVELENITDAG